MPSLNKQIWLADIMEDFYPDGSFLTAADNFDAWVENDTINLAEAGVEPEVLINNTTYPVAFAERSDTPHALVLDYYDTKGTVLRNAELVELSYDKRGSVTKQHKNALLKSFQIKAAHAYAPAGDTSTTPVIATTGAAANGFKVITFKDILSLKAEYDLMDAPLDRVLVLNPLHFNQLAAEDLNYLRGVMANGNELFGFKLFNFSKTPIYNKSTGAKVALGAAAAPTTDTISSFAFVGSEVMRAQGTFDMFERLKDPEQKGDIINFQMRGLAMPKRNKYTAAIYSAGA